MSVRPLPLALPLVLVFALGARKPDDPRHENHFAAGPAPTSDAVALSAKEAHAQQDFASVVAEIGNKTGDRIVVVDKTAAVFAFPDGRTASPEGTKIPFMSDRLVVQPNDRKSHNFKVTGSGFHVDGFTLRLDGFASAPVKGKTLSAPDFAVPPSRNDFTAGGFTCTLDDRAQKTDLTKVTFSCLYEGKGVGIVDPSKIGVKEPGGQEFANTASGKRDFVFSGEKTKVVAAFKIDKKVVDMQFATLQILWRDAFAESALSPVKLGDWSFTLDPAATAKANE